MTSYLHIGDDDQLLEQLAVAAHDWEHPDCRHPDGRLSDCYMFAHSVLAVLRGLSVEPTKRPKVQCARCGKAVAVRLSGQFYPHNDRYDRRECTGSRTFVAAPVPVQEDRP
jgi:hypothetical protein